MRTLFLNPPTFEDFDGGAGARYPASREVTSFWFPTWLCYPAGMIEGSRVVDAPVQKLDLDDCLRIARDYDLVVIYTSTPTLALDIGTARRIKEQAPSATLVFAGPHATVLPEETLRAADGAVDIVCRGEFDYTVKELADGTDPAAVTGISYRADGAIRHNPDRPLITDLDALPFVSHIYRRDLPIESYIIPHFRHPYVSIHSGRGCPYRCTYCLWPQAFYGHTLRTRSLANVHAEVKWIKENLPRVRDIAFEDDTFSADRRHARAVAETIGPLGVSWVINARADCDFETLRVMREAGLHHVIVGFESGDEQILKNIKKGVTLAQAETFTRDCRRLGLAVHGCFVLGLPGETRETIRKTIEFAKRLDLNTMQVSIASPYPGTELYEQCRREGWLISDAYVDEAGHQLGVVGYPHLSSGEIFEAVDRFQKEFFFRPRYILRSIGRMIADGEERRKLLRAGREFLAYRRKRAKSGAANPGR
jgi:hopanoid biosynthesis associated radical SAM protein HpnJ